MTPWRFVDAGEMDAPVGFGRMPVLAGSVTGGGPEVLMTGIFGRGHFQIGWFEDVDAVLDLDAARRLKVDVFRRPIWGGGTAFYDTRASAFFSFFSRADRFATLDDALEHFRPAMSHALDAVGLGEAAFEGSSDIRWRGRKLGTLITQSVLGTTVVGGFLNLKRPNMDLYRQVAHVPEEKFADKAIKDMVEYICTPGEVRGQDLEYEELRDAVVAAASHVAGLELDPLPPTEQEEEQTRAFVDAVSVENWVRRISSVRFRESAPSGSRVGFANYKARKLVRAGVALDDDGVILAAMMAGDMHVSPPDAMDRLGVALLGTRVDDRAGLLGRTSHIFATVEQADVAAGITPEDCVETVMLAAKAAGVRGPQA